MSLPRSFHLNENYIQEQFQMNEYEMNIINSQEESIEDICDLEIYHILNGSSSEDHFSYDGTEEVVFF